MRRIRVAAHVHSEWSYDASWTLPRLARAFSRRGYDAVLMAEHDQGFDPQRWQEYAGACAAASTGTTLLIPGIEYSDADNAVHIPVWGDVPFLGTGSGTLRLLERCQGAGGFAVFAHPWRRQAWRRFEEDWLQYLSAVEIWNRKYDGWRPRPEAVALAQRAAIQPFVALDFHQRRQFFPLALGLDIDGPVSRAAVQHALEAGRFEPLFLSRHALEFTGGVAAKALAALDGARAVAGAAVRRMGRRSAD